MPSHPNLSQLHQLHRDLWVASLCLEAFNELTPAVRAGVSHWFEDVEVNRVFPLPALELTDDERLTLNVTVIDEMLAAVQHAISDELDDETAFKRLAPILDPLYREFYGLHAAELNALWEAHRPKDRDEREMRIHMIESITGLDRAELVERASQDQDLLAFISRAGLTLHDLGNPA